MPSVSAPITVPFVELGEEFGLQGGYDDSGQWITRPLLCLWKDRDTLINEIAAPSQMRGGLSGLWVPTVPYQDPENPKLYAHDLTWKPAGAIVPGHSPIQYTYAIITVTFRQPNFNWQGSDDPGNLNSISQDPDEAESLLLATQELDFAKEWISIPNSSVKFKSDGLASNSHKQRSITIITMVITWHRYPVMPMGLVRNYVDTVNNKTFLGCPKGTVKFLGPKTIREATSSPASPSGSNVTQKVTFTFQFRQYPWNQFVRDDGSGFDYLVNATYAGGAGGDSSGVETFAYMDFSKLLL